MAEGLSLLRGIPPRWAAGWGEDLEHGVFAECGLEQVTQRFRWMPPGRFRMGSPESEAGRDIDEGPQHEVELTQGFWLGETPVTQGLWMSLMGKNPSQFQTDDRPVEQVSWFEAVLFCNRLSEHAGVEPVYYQDAGFRQVYAGGKADVFWKVGAAGFRLPTEAEWEYACRAGTTAATWRGDLELLGERNAPLLDEIAWYGGNSGKDFDLKEGHDSSGWPAKQYPHTKAGTRPVRLKQPNPWGLHDMLGNVWEWCYDHAGFPPGKYQADRQQDPVNMAGSGRVIRGGSWCYLAGYVRAAFRLAFPPGDRDDCLGFRLASGPAQGAEPQAPGGRDTAEPGGRT